MFLKKIKKMPWQTECELKTSYRAMTVQVNFSHNECEDDETEFCIKAWSNEELANLFETFCEENHFKNVTINSLTVVRVASTMEDLVEMEENL